MVRKECGIKCYAIKGFFFCKSILHIFPQESESLVQPRSGRGAQEERGRGLQVDICVALVVASEAALEVDVSFEVALEVEVKVRMWQ